MSRCEIIGGDCREVMAAMEPESVDAIVTDPPYGLEFMGKEWDRLGRNSPPSCEHSMQDGFKGFKPPPRPGGLTIEGMHAAQEWHEAWAREAYRVLKPGGHLLAFGGSRTYHRMACAVEDAGFEIRDQIMWLYGSGFPKSLDVSKAIDKAVGAEREKTGRVLSTTGNRTRPSSALAQSGLGAVGAGPQEHIQTIPATDSARRWQGWGTALKPAHEPIVVARKPLIGTVAENVERHGTGALNIDGCRIESQAPGRRREGEPSQDRRYTKNGSTDLAAKPGPRGGDPAGRWPANVVMDEEAGAMLDAQSGKAGHQGEQYVQPREVRRDTGAVSPGTFGMRVPVHPGGIGGASRFFYCPKASRSERERGLEGVERRPPGTYAQDEWSRENMGSAPDAERAPIANHHPTVKPVDLMRWLVRLVTPPGGLVLDPFAGSGTTGIACSIEGFGFVGIEQDPEYAEIARQRITEAPLSLFAEYKDGPEA